MDKKIITLMVSEMAALVSATALFLVSTKVTDQVVCAGMVGMIVGLTAGIIIGACWGLGWTRKKQT
jgi:preprotein translocase subunit SecF